jgi:hypothetical protein
MRRHVAGISVGCFLERTECFGDAVQAVEALAHAEVNLGSHASIAGRNLVHHLLINEERLGRFP